MWRIRKLDELAALQYHTCAVAVMTQSTGEALLSLHLRAAGIHACPEYQFCESKALEG